MKHVIYTKNNNTEIALLTHKNCTYITFNNKISICDVEDMIMYHAWLLNIGYIKY